MHPKFVSKLNTEKITSSMFLFLRRLKILLLQFRSNIQQHSHVARVSLSRPLILIRQVKQQQQNFLPRKKKERAILVWNIPSASASIGRPMGADTSQERERDSFLPGWLAGSPGVCVRALEARMQARGDSSLA